MKELELEMQQQFPHFPGTQPVYQQPVYQQEPVIMSVHEAITIIDDTPPHSPAPVIVHDTPPQSPTLLIMSPQAPALSVDHSILDALGLDIPGINDVQSCTSTSESPGPVQSTATTPIDIPSIEDLLEPLETSKAKPAPQASTPEKTTPPTEFTPLAELIEHLPSAGPLTPESEGEMSGCSNVDISFGMSLIEDDEDLEAFLSSVSATAPAADSLDFSPNGDIKWFEDFPDAGDYDDEGPVVSVCAPPTPEEIISRETWERNLFGDMIGV
jgi:hypothetical protein